ncbi:hypothetical protein JKP88DRAFT_250795 [Tribonema minus]|uniref:Uncharacterized protein n=1 Tax=Tribonema minus TaxID=303371 RepID=A0A835ZDM0_9STRA|nr:hypothetical protein JKP88DRAFT_250795 [Tribonema minus]
MCRAIANRTGERCRTSPLTGDVYCGTHRRMLDEGRCARDSGGDDDSSSDSEAPPARVAAATGRLSRSSEPLWTTAPPCTLCQLPSVTHSSELELNRHFVCVLSPCYIPIQDLPDCQPEVPSHTNCTGKRCRNSPLAGDVYCGTHRRMLDNGRGVCGSGADDDSSSAASPARPAAAPMQLASGRVTRRGVPHGAGMVCVQHTEHTSLCKCGRTCNNVKALRLDCGMFHRRASDGQLVRCTWSNLATLHAHINDESRSNFKVLARGGLRQLQQQACFHNVRQQKRLHRFPAHAGVQSTSSQRGRYGVCWDVCHHCAQQALRCATAVWTTAGLGPGVGLGCGSTS